MVPNASSQEVAHSCGPYPRMPSPLPPLPRPTDHRVGPGKFSIGGQEVAHPYDADGFVTSTAIRGGQAYFRSRFVRTAE